MDATVWSEIVGGLGMRESSRAAAAAARLHSVASVEDIPKLLALLESDDFFVREAAAWPLAELAGTTYLRELLVAYQRGFDQGHDNDGFTAALLEIPALHPQSARSAISAIAASSQEPVRGHAEWLLTFCAEQ